MADGTARQASDDLRYPAPDDGSAIPPKGGAGHSRYWPTTFGRDQFTMLQQRLLSAAVLIPIVLAAVYIGGWAFFTLVLVVTLLAGREYYRLLARNSYRPFGLLGLAMIAGIIAATAWPNQHWDRLVLGWGIVFALLWQLIQPSSQRSLNDWAVTVVGAIYIGWLASFMLFARNLPDGFTWMLLILLATWANDSAGFVTGTYLAGRYLGRHPFAPVISPKKTWEGSVAGWLACTLVTAVLATRAGAPPVPSIGLGLVLGVLATTGDLSVSFIKRQVRVKDSGGLIPGHGGMLDRIDSLLFVSPAVYYFALWFIQPR